MTLPFRSLLGLTLLASLSVTAAQAEEVPSLKGKRIGITVVGTEHYWDLKAYQGQIDEVKRLGGTVIALDAGRNDSRQISQIQTLIAQKPDAIVEQLGNAPVLQPWLKKNPRRGHSPLHRGHDLTLQHQRYDIGQLRHRREACPAAGERHPRQGEYPGLQRLLQRARLRHSL